MGTNQIQVNLKFNADVQQAKQSMLDLQNSLRNLTTTDLSKSMGTMGLTQEIQEATVKVTQLRTQLEAATNVNTGKLNLKTFNTQLKTSGNTLEQYKASLMALGPAGQQAFAQLARSVATAETPIISLGTRMEKVFGTLANTARWQIASSVINGLSGAMQKAYGYAQDLNRSLTDIRIVSGYSANEMAKFAESANKAAKALGSTTTAYTNAALIYYQQGLSNAEVEERTATTIKMANVTGENAEAVSSYMTAIWNNFDDGSKSLEYYADVITALGAATAASSEEIAGGLEKFAAIGETIGLSYEYATAALTTIVAETRQSEDVVGTALKTIFARIQGLKLGETLEDGTDLNKYSAALASIGVNIKDTSGNLKDMDMILDEVGVKWKTLARDEQMALAQTVAGVRQYTQFVALMDNYQDIFKNNLSIAQNSEGALQEQQDIYAESWEAASKRAQAATENIYQALLNDEFFIKLTNIFAEMTEGLGEFLDNIGGMKTVLLLLGSIITQVFNQQIANGLTKVGYNIFSMTKKGKQELETLKTAGFDMLKSLSNSEGINAIYDKMAEFEQKIIEAKKRATEAEKQHYDQVLQTGRALFDQALASQKIADAAMEKKQTSATQQEEQVNNILDNEYTKYQNQQTWESGELEQKRDQSIQRYEDLNNDQRVLKNQYVAARAPETGSVVGEVSQNGYEDMSNYVNTILKDPGNLSEADLKIYQKLKELLTDINNVDTSKIEDALRQLSNQASQAGHEADELIRQFEEASPDEHGMYQATFNDKLSKGLVNPESWNEKTQTFDEMAAINKRGETSIGGRLQDVDETAAQNINILKTATLEATEEFSKFQVIYDEILGAGKIDFGIKDDVIDIDKASKSAKSLSQNLSSFKGSKDFEKLKKVLPGVANAMKDLGEEAEEVSKINFKKLKGKELEEAKEKVKNLAKTYNSLGPEMQAAIGKNKALQQALSEIFGPEIVNEWVKDAREGGQAAGKAVADGFKVDPNKLVAPFEQGKEKIKTFNKGLTDMSSMLMSVATGIQALQSLGSIWNDEDLTVGEKLVQTMMSLSMIIPMVTTFTQNETMQTMASAISKKILTAATSANTVATGASTAAKGAETAAVTANTTAWYANPIMWIALIIVAVVAAVLLLVKGIQALSEALKSPEEKLNDMKNTLNEMSEATKRAQDELDNLKSSFDNFNSLQDPFKTLKKGTEEWTQAMYEANTAALEILKEHPELYGMEMNGEQAVTVEDGVYKIADWAQEQLLQAQMKEVMILQAVEAQKRYDVNKFELEIKQDELIDSLPKILSEELETRNLDSNKELKKYFEELALSDRRKGLNDQNLTKEIKQELSKMGMDNPEQITEAILAGLSEYDLQNLEINNALDTNTKALEANTLAMVSSLNSQYIKGYNNLSEFAQQSIDRRGATLIQEYKEDYLNKEGGTWTSYNSQGSANFWGGFSDGMRTTGAALIDTFEGLTSVFRGEGLFNFDYSNTKRVASQDKYRTNFQTSEDLVYEYAEAQGYSGGKIKNFHKKGDVTYVTEDGTELTWQQSDIYNWKAQTGATGFYEDNINNDKVVNAIQYLDTNSWGQSILKLGGNEASELTEEDILRFSSIYFQDLGYDTSNMSTEELAHLMGRDLPLTRQAIGLDNSNTYGFTHPTDSQGNPIGLNIYTPNQQYGPQDPTSVMWDTYDHPTDSPVRQRGNAGGETFFYPIVQALVETQGEDYTYEPQDLREVVEAIMGTQDVDTVYKQIGDLLLEWDAEESKATQIRHDEEAAQSYIDQAANSYGFDPEVLKVQAEQLRKVNSELELSAEQAAQLAVENARMNKGLETLVDNWDDWGKALKSSDKTTQDWAEAAVGCTDAIIDLVGASADLELPASFFEDANNIALIEKAAKGSTNAINELGVAVAQTQVEMMSWSNDMTDMAGNIIDLTAFETAQTGVLDGLQLIRDNINQLKAGASIDDLFANNGQNVDKWISDLNTMAIATQMSVEEMQGILNSLGVQAEVVSTTKTMPVEVPEYTTINTTVDSVPGYELKGNETAMISKTWQTGSEIMEGKVTVAQINTGDDLGDAPKVKFVGNGSVNPSSKKGSGGGGGGGGSKKKKQDKKKTSDEKERYHVINKQLDMLSREYDKVSKAADRAFGPAKLKLLDQQIAKTKEQIEAEKEHLKQINNYLKTDKADMSKYGAEFDEDGVILNYDKLVEEQVAIYNKAVDAFNKSAQGEADDEALQKAEEAYEEFQEKMSQYEETVDLKFDTEQALKDLNYQLQDEELQALVVDIEYKISVNESQLEYLEFLLDRVDDNAFKAAESMGLLGQQTEIAFQNLDYYSNKLREMLLVEGGLTEAQYGQFMQGIDTVFEGTKFENNEALIEQAKEWRSAMIEENQNLFDIQEQVQEKVLEVFDAWTEKLDQQTSIVEHAASVLEHYKNIIDIVGQDRLGISDQLLSALQDAQHEVQLNAIEQSRYAYEAAAQSLVEAEAAYKQALISGDEERIKYWEETVATMRETVDGYQEEMMSKLTDGLQQAADRFGTAIEKIGQKFRDEMARGYGTAEYMQRAYDRYNEENERYIEEYQKIYELSKLTRDIQKAIDESDNIKAKQELSKLQDQINQKLESGAKMSEYELSVLQAEFELKQAEIALEEAQNAKSQVRLSRDSKGNYGYVYTADQEQIDQATANYEEKLYNLQDVTQQYIEELTSETLALYGEYADKVMELNQMLAEGRITKEQYDQMLAETQEYYGKRLDYIGGQMQIALDNAAALYDSDHGHYYDYLLGDEGKKAFDEDYMQHFRDTFLGEMGLNYNSWHELELDFQLKSQKMLYDLGEAYRLFEQEVDESLNAAGLDMETFSDATRKAMDESIKASQDAAKATEKMKTDMVKDMKEIIREVEIWQVKYSEAINAVIKDIESLLKKYKELEAAQKQQEKQEKKETPKTTTPSTGGGGGKGSSKNSNFSSMSDKEKLALAYAVWNGSAGWGNGTNRKNKVKEKFGEGAYEELQAIVDREDVTRKAKSSAWLADLTGLVSSQSELKQKYGYSSFDTGGYTGSWGQEGRLAMLHQKELVLNAKDTENMLSAVSVIRDLVQQIDLQAISVLVGASSLMPVISARAAQPLQQDVTIHAEFPNVQDRNEIEEAFKTLVNEASQYANRKR